MPPCLNDLTQWCWLALDKPVVWQKTLRWTTGMRDCKNWLYGWVALGDVLYQVSCNLDVKIGSNTPGISQRLRHWASLQHWLSLQLSCVMHYLCAMCRREKKITTPTYFRLWLAVSSCSCITDVIALWLKVSLIFLKWLN